MSGHPYTIHDRHRERLQSDAEGLDPPIHGRRGDGAVLHGILRSREDHARDDAPLHHGRRNEVRSDTHQHTSEGVMAHQSDAVA